MSRITPEAHAAFAFLGIQSFTTVEDPAMHLRANWAWRGDWISWVVRAFLVACTGAVSYTLGPFDFKWIGCRRRGSSDLHWRFCWRSCGCGGRR